MQENQQDLQRTDTRLGKKTRVKKRKNTSLTSTEASRDFSEVSVDVSAMTTQHTMLADVPGDSSPHRPLTMLLA